jgi:uncharacterized protein (DUF2252 family)
MNDPRNIINRLQAFNQVREPERLARKYAAMRENAFAFFRGTCHLFYQDWPADAALNEAPAGWICGDLHLENFGSYKANNRLVYFDVNDFDEAALAPVSWDLTRFLTSVWEAGDSLKLEPEPTHHLCQHFLSAYASALSTGKSHWIERSLAEGMIGELLKKLKKRSRKAFIDSRTENHKGKLRLHYDDKHALKAKKADREKVTALIDEFANTQTQPEFFQVIDVARRVAGVSSLGLERYVILIEGKGGMDGHYLLDLKHQPGSSLRSYLALPQPDWPSEAQRVVSMQQRGQAAVPAFLSPLTMDGKSYVLRELMPTQDRLRLKQWDGEFSRLEHVLVSMGKLAAWSHLRSAGQQGSALVDEWIAFGNRGDWQPALLDYAKTYAQQVKQDFRAFSTGYDAGEFD